MESLWDIDRERETATEQYHALLRSFSALSERPMRRELLAERLLSLSLEECTELLRLICLCSPQSTEAAQLLLAFQDQAHAQHRLSYQDIRAIYECARERGYHNVQRLFLTFSQGSHEEAKLRPHPQMKGLSLGERKFLARKFDIQMLEKLLADPDPTVIRNLLQNPRITEKEVVWIASKRPNSPAILEEIARSPRWFSRYRVKTALVQNPHIPFAIALQILPFLTIEDLRQIAHAPNLHPQIVDTAHETLRLRSLPQLVHSR